jgi:phenylpyruvate tautomerase PptA (4-oxalocrotonate tautomerase family)
MPFLQIHTSRRATAATRRTLGFALAKAYGECMATSNRIVNVGFSYYDEGDLVRYDAAGDGAQEMTVVTCDVRSGRAPEVLEQLGRSITALCSRELGIAEARVAVYLTEHAAYQIYRDGGRAPAWSAAEGTPPGPDVS